MGFCKVCGSSLPLDNPQSRSGWTEGEIQHRAGHLQGPVEGPKSTGVQVLVGCRGVCGLTPHLPCDSEPAGGLPGSGWRGSSPCLAPSLVI